MFRKKVFSISLFKLCFLTSFIAQQALNGEALFNYAKENSPTLKNSTLSVELAEQQIKKTIASGLPKFNGPVIFLSVFINFINALIKSSI